MSSEAVFFFIVEAGTVFTNNEATRTPTPEQHCSPTTTNILSRFLMKDDAAKYQCSVHQVQLICISCRICHFSTSNKDSLVSTLASFRITNRVPFHWQKLASQTRDQDGHRATLTRLVPFSSWPMGAAQRPDLYIC